MSTALQPAPAATPTRALPPAAEPPGPVPIATPPAAVFMVDRLHRLTLAQYHAMAGAGILAERDRVELLGGLLVNKMTKIDRHILATELVQGLLIGVLPAGWFLSMQNPIAIAEVASEPEPDAKVVRGAPRDYKDRRVVGGDVGLVVEVSDSSVREDQTTKKALYALASIPFFWLINLPANRVEAYADPTGPDPSPDYRRRSDHGPDDAIPLVLDGLEVARIAVRDLLP